jgi:outer membrane protein TolC
VENHPEIRQLALSLADASLSRDLKREQLKPELNLSYYLLGDGFALPEMDGSPFAEAYKFGLTASYPILNRKARAGAQLGELKVLESEAKLGAKTQSIFTKATAYFAASQQYLAQLVAGEALAAQAAQLLAAERELYDLGESTQFVLNQREQALLKARMGVAKLRLSRTKAVATYRYLRAAW